MRIHFLAPILFLSSLSFAKEVSKNKITESRKPTQEMEVQVIPLTEDYPTEGFKGEGYQTHEMPGTRSEILAPEIRDQILAATKIDSLVAGWDQLEKDILILRAKNSDLRKLKSQYPRIPVQQLQMLQAYVKRIK